MLCCDSPVTIAFQSAPPVKGATRMDADETEVDDVSIRAPREGGDDKKGGDFAPHPVSIRAPREGGDTSGTTPANGPRSFNPRPP